MGAVGAGEDMPADVVEVEEEVLGNASSVGSLAIGPTLAPMRGEEVRAEEVARVVSHLVLGRHGPAQAVEVSTQIIVHMADEKAVSSAERRDTGPVTALTNKQQQPDTLDDPAAVAAAARVAEDEVEDAVEAGVEAEAEAEAELMVSP